MACLVLILNCILFSLSWTAASASSSNAESSNISNSSSSDDGSLSSSGLESLPLSAASSSNSDSDVFSSRKRAPATCPKGKRKSSCPKHEVRSKCIQAYCKPQKCSERGREIPCNAIAGPCEKGCVCKNGYLRNSRGRCIPEHRCPPVCPDSEEFSNCTQAVCRQQTCKDKKNPLSCCAIKEGDCNSGCVCQSGYLRAPEGECVPENQCSGDLVCKTNEVVDNCPNSGHGDCCPRSEKDAKSRKQSKVITECEEESCTCRFNYMRAENGTCIPARDCPPFNCTGENEEFNSCPPLCPTDDCAQATPSGRCPLPGRIGIVLQCRADCRCKTGFWRKNGVCVPYSECPGICPLNEEYSNCIQGVCRAQNCTQKGKPIACADVAEGSCEKGCICSTGFLRDEHGNCIPDDQCPAVKCNGQNEFLAECANGCDPINCPESLQAEQETLAGCNALAVCLPPDCRCRPDYRRDEQGRCIPIGECPGICPTNEEFSNCTQALCRTQNCTQRGKPIACPGIAEESCEKGCVCSTGFLRNGEGNCVPEDQCPICRSNENFSNCIQAICRTLNCSQRGFPLACPYVAKSKCQSGCVCPAGFLKTAKGDCVHDSECYEDLVCGDNEDAIASRNDATNDYCPRFEGDKGDISRNTSEAEGPVCVCRFNHKRSYENRTCIPTVDCPPFECNRPYEEYRSCPPWCPSDNCSQATPTGRCQIFGRIGIVLECNPKCRCIQGYWRDNGTCVPYAACPGKCPINERYSSCIQAECRALNCTQKGKPIACPRLVPGACKNGCVCVEGTLRAENGSCIPEIECPVCPVNEEFSNCTQAVCRQQTCKDKKMPLSCPAIKEGDCNSGCVCQSGYLRTPEGECVPQNQCSGDLVCKTDEVVDNCPNSGHGDCCPRSEKDAKSRKQSKVITECEEESCTCRFNYMRAKNGTCIPARDCPPFNCTGDNEEFNSCPPLCPTDDCAQATPSGRCPLPGRIGIVLQCRADCRCKTGFWRKNGVCVPYSECPGICPLNEEYSNCIQGVCRAQNCTQKGKPIACADFAEGSCEKGCICSTGFLRDEHGNCIPDDQCPALKCDGQNEFLAQCANGCDPINCPESLQAEQETLADCIAPAVCLPPDCRCRPNYRRDEEERCIPIGECPGICPNNEEFSNCTQALCRAQNCTQKGKPIACAGIAEGSCTKGCVCLNGFLRDEHGNCIPDDQCQADICPDNEEFSNCTQALCRAQNCTQKGKPIACPLIAEGFCEKGCVCSSGFLRDEDGNCIPDDQCPAASDDCPPNEEYSTCTQAVCRAQDCTQRGMLLPCAAIAEGYCLKGCICVYGYLRDVEGHCVAESKCAS